MTQLLQVFALTAAAVVAGQGQVWRSVENTQCGLTVQVPNEWTVQPVGWNFGSEADCAVGLRPPDWLSARERSDKEIPEFAIYIGVSTGTLETACEKLLVCRDSRGWFFEGRAGARSPGHDIRTKIGSGIRGEVETGSYLKQGGYAGESSAFIAVLSRERRLAEFIADNEFWDEPIFDRIVQAFEFR